MSQKNRDNKNRWRNKTVAFRVSPDEWEQVESFARLSGLNKQDYELQGDYYLPCLALAEEERKPIGIWGQRHLEYIKQHKRVLYTQLLTSGKLNSYLADVNEQAVDMLSCLVKELARKENVTEQLKADNQMEWVRRMNNIRSCAEEVILNQIICK